MRSAAFRVAQLVARVDRFAFAPTPAHERVWNAIAIGLAFAVLVIMFSAALRGAVGHIPLHATPPSVTGADA